MMSLNRSRHLFYILFVFAILLSQNVKLFAQQVYVKGYSGIDGPASNYIRNVTQDNENVLWFATWGGISSFDGTSWNNYNPEDCLGIVGISYLVIDSKNHIWGISEANRLIYYDRNNWISYEGPEINEKLRLYPSGVESIEQNDSVAVIIGSLCQGAYIFKNENWTSITSANGLPSDSITQIISYKNTFLVGTDKGMVYVDRFGNVTPAFENIQFPDNYIKTFAIEYNDISKGAEDGIKRLWVGGPDWIGYIQDGIFRELVDIKGLIENRYDLDNIIQPDYAGGIILGNQRDIYHIKYDKTINKWESYNEKLSVSANRIFMDNEYNIWVCAFNGIYKVTSLSFMNYDSDELGENIVAAITETKDNKIVFTHNFGYTTKSGELFKYTPLNLETETTEKMSRVIDIVNDDSNNLWLAITTSGILKINPEEEKKLYRYPFLRGNEVSTILLDSKNNDVLIGSNYGLYKLDTDSDQFLPTKYEIPDSTFIRKLVRGWDNKLYVASGSWYSGLFVIENDSITIRAKAENEGYNSIYDIFLTQDSTLFLGTLGGLATLSGNKIVPYKQAGLSIEIPLYSITEDNNGNYWFGTNNGVFFWDGIDQRHYDATTGFVGNEVNRNAKLVDNEGKVWIGTDSGVSHYDGKYDFWGKRPKPIADIVSIVVGEKNYSPSEPISVSYGDNTIAIRYRGISYIDEKKNKFKYWMEGASEEWSEEFKIVNQPLVFPNLKHGDYRFHIQVCNAQGQWSDIVTSENINIRHPLWMSWWFISLLIFCFIAIAYSIQRAILTRKYAGKLEVEVKNKTGELEDHKDHLEEVVEERTEELSQRTTELSISNESLINEISHRQLIQVALEENHTHLESIINNVEDAIVTVGHDGKIISANDQYSQLFNISINRVVNSRITEQMPIEELLLKSFGGQSVSQKSIKVPRSSTEDLAINVKVSPLNLNDGNVQDVMVVIHDRTRLTQLQSAIDSRESYHSIIGKNYAMLRIYDQIEDLSDTNVTILITGESGAGKELIAAALHNSSQRAKGPFIKLNCAALPENVLESELFGHVKGAFTGAIKDRTGRFELAKDGTLFLDEIGEISHNMQLKLLRVLETGEFERVGDSRTLKTDARIISATNKDLILAMESGEFRRDLFYRLNVINITLPPLRERRDDIPLLVNHFVDFFKKSEDEILFSSEAMQMLINYPWTGNVRELRNSIERAIVVSKGDVIQPEHLPDSFKGILHIDSDLKSFAIPKHDHSLADKKRLINTPAELKKALDTNSWNVSDTAKMLNVSRNTLYRKIKTFNISRPDSEY
jgi:two-component system, NtrC family, response regulator HydG